MSRSISNKGLSDLCKKHEVSLADVAFYTNSNRRSVYKHITGRKHMPRLEEKMAELFDLTVPQLRKRLGLKNQREG